MEIKISEASVAGFLEELSCHGYDFTGYSKASFEIRLSRLWLPETFTGLNDFQTRIRMNPDYLQRCIQEITVNVTGMFRDPSFYKTICTQVQPSRSKTSIH